MKKVFKLSDIRKLNNEVFSGEISSTRMVEILNEMAYSAYNAPLPEQQKKVPRCCGRCNGIDDICVADSVCSTHDKEGCVTCYGAVEKLTGGIDKYLEDLIAWDNSLYCSKCCSNEEEVFRISQFSYSKNVSNGEMWICNYCKNEVVVKNKPRQIDYY